MSLPQIGLPFGEEVKHKKEAQEYGCIYENCPFKTSWIKDYSEAKEALKRHIARAHSKGEQKEPCNFCKGRGGISCPYCEGSGEDESGFACFQCEGVGFVRCPECLGAGVKLSEEEK